MYIKVPVHLSLSAQIITSRQKNTIKIHAKYI